MNGRNLFKYYSSGGWKPMTRCRQVPGLERTCFLAHQHRLLAVTPWRKGPGALWALFYKGADPTWGIHPRDLRTPKGPPPNTITLGSRLQHTCFGGLQIFSLWHTTGLLKTGLKIIMQCFCVYCRLFWDQWDYRVIYIRLIPCVGESRNSSKGGKKG